MDEMTVRFARMCLWCAYWVPDPDPVITHEWQGDRLVMRVTRLAWEIDMLAHIQEEHPERLADIAPGWTVEQVRAEATAQLNATVRMVTAGFAAAGPSQRQPPPATA